jgi:hypothetical protein
MKLPLTALAVVMMLSIGGIAYAACTGGGAGCGSPGKGGGQCPTSLNLIWTEYSTPVPSASTVSCTAAITTSTLLTLGASNLAPGESCVFDATLTNTGTIPATLGDVIDPVTPCTGFSYTDNINQAYPAPGISAGGTFSYSSTVSLSASAGNACQHSSATFAVTITGTGAVPTLTPPKIFVSPTPIYSGQSATLTTTTSFSGGASPYTCQWLVEAPGASSYSDLGSSFSCSAGSTPSTSTGTLSTTGTWHFELQVTDSEPVTVTSNSVTVTVNTKPVTYSITFSEKGLPSGLTWKVTVNGVSMSLCTNGGTDSLTWPGLASGTYSYVVTGNPGWHQSTLPYSGTVVVSGASVTEPTLVYSAETYTVTFTETGLPSGDSWSITMNGVTMSSTGSTIVFTEVNGTYSYKVGAISGCGESKTSGTVTVNGANVSVSISISKK